MSFAQLILLLILLGAVGGLMFPAVFGGIQSRF